MVQILVVYLIVAVAAGWTTWRLFLRGWLQRRAAAAKPNTGCGPGCGCHD